MEGLGTMTLRGIWNLEYILKRLVNGAVEAANKNIKKILRKMVENDRSWHEMLPYAFLGYLTIV